MDDLPQGANNLLDGTKDNLTELIKSHPLAIGAVGIAIGAAIAAAFPATETETAYLGQGSEFVKEEANEFAGEQVERATEMGMRVVARLRTRPASGALPWMKIKSAASEVSGKATRVAEGAIGDSRTESFQLSRTRRGWHSQQNHLQEVSEGQGASAVRSPVQHVPL